MDTLFMTLNKSSNMPLYEQIYMHIRQDITDGKLAVGQKLPSKRKLGAFLEVSQTTIELAYEQLAAEGYVRSKPRSGFYVEDIGTLIPVRPHYTFIEHEEKKKYRFDLRSGRIDATQFPFDTWRKYAKDLIDENRIELLQLGHPYGERVLREEIARYLYHSRGVDCAPEQVIIGSGTEQLLPLLVRLLPEDTSFALEDPGYLVSHRIFHHLSRTLYPIPVDEEGIDVDQLLKSDAHVAYVTPSHQFPTGAVLSAARKTMLLNWAAQTDRLIIEDDYDSEFRYSGRPIPSLQSMDGGRHVVYMSTFSKSFMPSLRIAYMVLPPHLLVRYEKEYAHYASTVPRFDQHLLASFMRDGHYSRHLNRMRLVYKKKLAIVTAFLDQFAPTITYEGEQAGLHITIQVHVEQTTEQLALQAEKQGIHIRPITDYSYESLPKTPTFILGFASLPNDTLIEALDTLMKAWQIK